MRQKFNETLNRKPVELLSVHSRMRHAIFKVSCNQQYTGFLRSCNKVPEAITRMRKFSMSVQGKYGVWYNYNSR